jgi:eukaryotic-like serine/threonine-protein kinase
VDFPSGLSEALRGRYLLERELGRGGMATVYLAQDLKHDRRVALKLLHPELATTLGPERFLREIHLTARLDHPHILPVFDSGAAGGLLWYTMPYVEGESLRERLQREGELPVEDAVRLAREVADALDCAHQEGMVHRDIKPENILLARGHARVADFGVARVVEAAGAGQLTETGLAVGTPAYMSPEQASGGHVDSRSDLYALGCVLYEMLAGEPPYTGPSAQAITAKRLSGEIPSVRRVRPAVSEPLEQVITKALARVPADRYQTAAEFARALDGSATVSTVARPGSTAMRASRSRLPAGILTLALGFLVGLGVLFAWRWAHARPGETAGPIRVAVLPFDNLGDSADAYFADGVTDAVRGKLAGLPQFQITASTSSNQYRRTTKAPREIGRELGVDYLLVGRIRWAKQRDGTSRVQVSPELVRVASASTTWQEPFDAPLTDVFQVQADIAGRVAGALGVALGATEQTALTARPTHDVAAYDAFIRGERELQESNPDAVRRAIAAYEEAVARDSTFAIAWARLAEARAEGSLRWGMDMGRGLLPRAREAAERALQLAPQAADGYRAMSEIVRFDAPKALELIRHAHELAPNDVEVLSRLASAEAGRGDEHAALDHLARARELDPRSVSVARDAAYALLDLHLVVEARHEVERGLAVEPMNAALLTTEAQVAVAQGDTALARAAAARLGAGPEAGAAMVVLWAKPWLLTEEQQRTYLRLPPDPFGGNRAWQANAFAILLRSRGDSARMRAYADSGLQAIEEWGPDSASSLPAFKHAIRGMLLGMRGRPREAHAEASAAVRGLSDRYSHFNAAYLKTLAAWTDVLAGENESAITLLEQVVAAPYWVTPAYLRVDPTWAPLRGNPRFQRLVGTQQR